MGKINKKNTEQFLAEVKPKWEKDENGNVVHDYSNTVYVKKEVKLTYFCHKHNRVVEQKPYLHFKNGCPFCNGRGIGKYTRDLLIQESIRVHGNLYDYDELEFNENNTVHDKIKIYCPKTFKDGTIHGHFEQKACLHIQGGNCPKCVGGVKISNDEFVRRATEQHNVNGEPKFDYSLCEYEKAHDKVKIKCLKHDLVFEQLAYMHLQNAYSCPKCANEITVSMPEKEIYEFIKSIYEGEIEQSNREILDGKEIDIYLPEAKIGFEYDCEFHHGESSNRGKDYHVNKLDLAEEKGIRLIQIFGNLWTDHKEIVKSRISSLLGKNKRIYARKTEIVILSAAEKRDFLNATHIKSDDKSSVKLGLKYNGEIVACMTFGKPRYNRNYDWELIRYSSALFTNVVGGAGKLLSYFRKSYQGTIISYADRRWSMGNLYFKLGFKLDGINKPGCFYYNIKNKTIHERESFQKHKLKKIMPFYDEKIDDQIGAEDIIKLNGYDRVWNSGQMRWILL